MSITIQQILLDAKRLASRLKEQDSQADALLSQSRLVFKQIDAMRQYQEELCEISESVGMRPQKALVASIRRENRQLRELQQENRELRSVLEDHQCTIELIMSKYREHVSKLLKETTVDYSKLINKHYDHTQTICQQHSKIEEMAAVMQKATALDEVSENKEKELLSRLAAENKVLRELMHLSYNYGSYQAGQPSPTEDKECQTEES